MTVRAGLGLGSNLGDRAEQITAAQSLIDALPGTHVRLTSRLYTSAPWGVTDQPEFLNSAALIDTELDPFSLLSALKQIEARLGRVESKRWGPRAIDIDILFYGRLELNLERLTLPHASLFDRAFVLVPLAELGPELSIKGQNIKRAAAEHPDSGSIKASM